MNLMERVEVDSMADLSPQAENLSISANEGQATTWEDSERLSVTATSEGGERFRRCCVLFPFR